MNEVGEPLKIDCCHGCLCKNEESMLRSYTIQHQALKSLFKVESLSLCSICLRLARHVDIFIQNVQSNQIFLENFHSITVSTLDNVRSQIQPVFNLSSVSQDIIELSGVDDGNIEDPFSVIYNCGWNKNAKIKVELKDEGPYLDHHLEEFVGDNDFQDTFMKEEDFPLTAFIKKELQFEELDPKYVKKLRSGAVIKQVASKNNKVKKKREETIKIETIRITKKQCMEERETQALDERYLDLPYKCEDCIKGFNFKEAYDRHREKHSKEMGDYECDVCKQRTCSEERLKAHRKYHELRYKCGECDFTRVCRLSVLEHYRAEHSAWDCQYHCPHCSKSFKKLKSMRKHNSYAHRKKERVTCALCLKTYATKEVLKTHMIRRHASELPAGAGAGAGAAAARRRHVCETCGARFGMPSLLSQHRVKHSLRRDYYCVECDKSFKTDAILKHHLKTASPHVTYNELPLACAHCEKRFSIKRDLERHTNSVHLKIKPFQCDKCDRAYVNGWSLTEHKRLSHEGYKRPLKYPCTLCDKVFDRNQILKEHMRTHTGERPFQCARCPAQFAQGSALGTHTRLVHLKLTRDGRPKAQAQAQAQRS